MNTNISAILTQIAENEPKIYHAGYLKGKSEGGGGDTEAAYEQGVADGKAYAEAVTMSMIDRSITEIDIPVGVTTIGSYCFSYCGKLKKITIPEGVKSIGANAMNGTALTELTLPMSCENVGTYSIYNCVNLKSITFGNIKTISSNALGANTRCTLYDFTRCEAVPTLNNTNAFNSINANAKILVPASLYDEWIAATNWSNFADYIEADSSLPDVDVPDVDIPSVSEGLEIDGTVVVGRGSCTDSVIVIPDGVTEIGEGAFVNDQVIDTLVLPKSSTWIISGSLDGSSLRRIENYYMGSSFALYGLSLDYISFIDSSGINGLELSGIQGSPVYDFSKCTVIVPINGDVESISKGENTQIIVPESLLGAWKTDTNWAYFADYIVAAE